MHGAAAAATIWRRTERPTDMNRLLIVDDDTELCSLLAERLGEDGFVLHAAHDGQRGLELASSGEYSLVDSGRDAAAHGRHGTSQRPCARGRPFLC